MKSFETFTALALAPSGQAISGNDVFGSAVCNGTFRASVHVARTYAKRTVCVKPAANPIVLADAPIKDDGTRVLSGHGFNGHADIPGTSPWLGALKSTATDQMIPQIPPSAGERTP